MEDPKTGRKIVLKYILNVDTMTPRFTYPGFVPMQSPTNPNHIYFEKAGTHTRFADDGAKYDAEMPVFKKKK